MGHHKAATAHYAPQDAKTFPEPTYAVLKWRTLDNLFHVRVVFLYWCPEDASDGNGGVHIDPVYGDDLQSIYAAATKRPVAASDNGGARLDVAYAEGTSLKQAIYAVAEAALMKITEALKVVSTQTKQ
jgi:hypothetical protein